MLTRNHRLTSSQVFAQTIRRGHRAGTRTLVLHLTVRAAEAVDVPARVGFVVSKAVGNAVVRNLVKRRLREVARARLTSLPGSSVLVVRALPAAATVTHSQLALDFDSALARVNTRLHLAGGLA